MFGDDIQIQLDINGLNQDKNYVGNTFFSTPAKSGSSIAVDILFKTGSANINETLYDDEISKLVQFLNFKQDINITIEGHTDRVGSLDINKNLSLKRAQSLRNILIKRGILEKRIKVEGLGSERPAYEYIGNSKSNELNRRIEIRID